MWRALALVLLGFIGGARAQEAGAPSGLVCTQFADEMTRALALAPDSLQVNNLLFDAARKGCVDALPELFKFGASRLARDRMGNTAFMLATRAGRLPMVKALAASATPEEAAELDRPNVTGSTPLIAAALANRANVAKWLIDAGAKVDAVNQQGESALSAAAFTGNVDLALLLLERGAKPDTIDSTGKGVIVYAAARGVSELVGKLIEAGVDPNARYRADLTALMWASGHADNVATPAGVETVKLLLARGAKVDFVDDRGRDALMIAASLGRVEIVRVLLAAGADPTRRDKAGKSAADLASSEEVKSAIRAP